MLREDLTSLRNEINLTARQNREEVNASVRDGVTPLVKQMMEMTMLQKSLTGFLAASNEQRLMPCANYGRKLRFCSIS